MMDDEEQEKRSSLCLRFRIQILFLIRERDKIDVLFHYFLEIRVQTFLKFSNFQLLIVKYHYVDV